MDKLNGGIQGEYHDVCYLPAIGLSLMWLGRGIQQQVNAVEGHPRGQGFRLSILTMSIQWQGGWYWR